jgi:hypothetical protein
MTPLMWAGNKNGKKEGGVMESSVRDEGMRHLVLDLADVD